MLLDIILFFWIYLGSTKYERNAGHEQNWLRLNFAFDPTSLSLRKKSTDRKARKMPQLQFAVIQNHKEEEKLNTNYHMRKPPGV